MKAPAAKLLAPVGGARALETAGATPPGVCRVGAVRPREERQRFAWLPRHAGRPEEFDEYHFRVRFCMACLRNWRAVG